MFVSAIAQVLLYLRCEHYTRQQNIDHFFEYNIGDGLDIDYLEALFINDHEAILDFEEDAASLDDVGPLVDCLTINNFSTIKLNCCTCMFVSTMNLHLQVCY